MARFSISLSVEVEADSYDDAYAIQKALFEFIEGQEDVISGPFEIDVEQQDGFEDARDFDDGQPDEATEWQDFDPDC